MKPSGKQTDLNGFLDKGSNLTGELRFDTHFRIHGRFSGTVVSEGELIVGEGGELEGDLHVGQVLVSGTVRGTIEASRRVQITAAGRVFADLDTPSLVLEDGAIFEGRCTMTRDGARAVTAAGPSSPKLVATPPPKVPALREN